MICAKDLAVGPGRLKAVWGVEADFAINCNHLDITLCIILRDKIVPRPSWILPNVGMTSIGQTMSSYSNARKQMDVLRWHISVARGNWYFITGGQRRLFLLRCKNPLCNISSRRCMGDFIGTLRTLFTPLMGIRISLLREVGTSRPKSSRNLGVRCRR
jgi:hypothetical protein